MCGIAGLWNLNGEPVYLSILARFTDSLAHRGPDGNGFYIDSVANLGLGHRRLAIIDTSDGGRQPMSFANERYWIVFNGEIYNFVELKSELEAHGYQFRSDSDTEIILAAYHCWGEDCQLQFNGMWALAIWDREERKLFLSRDRFGVKPLIYYFDQNHFAFASEMKAFLALDWFQPDFDPAMVAAALSNERLIEGDERCLLKGLTHLWGGHCLTLRVGEQPKIRRWWNTLDHLEVPPSRYEDQVERFRDLFLDACRVRMRSDVSIGTSLSGGLDSSSILCGMHHLGSVQGSTERMAREWQKAFVMEYPGSVIDERKYADEVIRHTGVTPIYCTGDANTYLENFDRVLFQLEDISDIHLGPWLVYKAQRENGVVVTIDGHGGDEALGGYPWYVTAAVRDSLRRLALFGVVDCIGVMKGLDLFPNENFYLKSAQSMFEKLTATRYHSWLLHEKAKFISPAFEADMPRIQGRDSLFKSLYTDFHFVQLPSVLRNFDRLSMAHGVEVRSPLMDWRLVCFAFSLPSSSKIGSGFTKRVLRDAMKGILPESIRTRTKKLGFTSLPDAWSSPRAREFICDSVKSDEFRQSIIWDGKRIAQELEDVTQNGNDPKLRQAWIYVQAMSLINLFQEKRKSYRSLA
ncbi:MAG: asparagine synthase (glutamine-hydrolyzing) [Chloroflexota bacterium]